MTDDLIKHKEEIINKHFENFKNAINTINKQIDDALKDDQKKAVVGAEFLQTLKVNIIYDDNSTLGMTSSDKLQYAKMWFDSKILDINTLKEISSDAQKSLLQTLDEQIEIGRQELEKVEDILKNG
jgi:hypothetical protein